VETDQRILQPLGHEPERKAETVSTTNHSPKVVSEEKFALMEAVPHIFLKAGRTFVCIFLF
jgi:hypothetical protein